MKHIGIICVCAFVSIRSFLSILYYTDGLTTFRNFLRSEFSEENIEFWLACEDFKKTKSPLKMASKAKKMYEDFIQAGGHKEVGLVIFKSILFYSSSSGW